MTSSGGTTQVIQTPLIANSNGTFSTLSLATCSIQNIVTTASIGTAPTTAITASATASGLVISTMNMSETTQSSNLITTSTIARPSPIESAIPISVPKPLPKQVLPSSFPDNVDTTTSANESSNIDSEPLPNLPSSLANLILSLPSVTTSGFSAEANAQAQSILQRLSEEDIKTLVTVLAKSTPNSPASSPVLTPDHGRSPIQSPRTLSTLSPLSEHFPPQSTQPGESKYKSLSAIDTKASPSPSFSTTANKISQKMTSHPLSLTQKVSAMQQDINKLRSPRLKAPRIITTGLSGKIQSPSTSSSTSSSSMGSNKQLHAKTQKVPITITIPISRLPSSLQLTTSNSKTINVPALSAYLAQQKFVLSTGKSSSLDSRTVLLGSSSSNKRIGGIMVSTNSTKGSTVFKTSQKDGSASKSAATITLHLPTQKETPLKKAASDIKLVGILNQKNKTTQLVSASSIKPSSLPSSPKSSPASPSPSTGELSPIQPRQVEESEVEPTKPSLDESESIDDSDIDFSVIPTGKSSLLSQHLPQQRNVRASFSSNIASMIPSTTTIATMPLAVNSKIIRVPVSSGDRRLFGSKNLMEFNKAKSAENQLMNSARKVGVAFQQVVKNAEVKQQSTNNDSSSRISTGVCATSGATTINGKLRFEPLHLPGSRPNYSAVLSSMNTSEDFGSRNTILAKPTVVNSKAAAMIARTAFITDTKLSNKTGISFSPLNKNIVATKTTTPALFSSGKSNHAASPLSTPAATIRTATTSKVLPVTIKSNDFIRMSSQVRTVQQNQTKPAPTSSLSSSSSSYSSLHAASHKIIKKETVKTESKPKPPKKAMEMKVPEPKEEPPPPYITRSGRVLRTRYPYADEVERKASPRKRRRNSSTSKEEATPPATPPPVITMGNIGSSLDSLVEAAKLITTSQEVSDNSSSSGLDILSTSSTAINHIDSTTNMAATAMLELLASNATTLPPQILDPPQDFVRGANDIIKPPEFVDPPQNFNRGRNDINLPTAIEFVNNDSIPKTVVSGEASNAMDTKPMESWREGLQRNVPAPFASLATPDESGEVLPQFEDEKCEREATTINRVMTNIDNTSVKIKETEDKHKTEIPVTANTVFLGKDELPSQSQEDLVPSSSISSLITAATEEV